ncbi:MAG: hypothetical protein GX458_12070 [Phyllobacteriaceae bacterium]|nr:hypothetical protein [Phyllobacteriaceae bacterium]
MPVTARPMPRSAVARAGAPARRPSRPPPAHRPPPHRQSSGDVARLVLIGAAIAVAGAIGVGVIWEYGAARNLSVPPGAIGAGADAAPPGGRSTTMYRDLHDGRIMVMEIGPGGTRLKGTVSKSEVPLANDVDREGGTSQKAPEPSASDRVNALGSAFR